MAHWDRLIKWWLAAAALLGLGIAGSYWSVNVYREWKIDQRVDRFMPQIQAAAKERGLPVSLVRSVVRAESGGDPRAVSEVNAKGLMQIMPTTHEDVVARMRVPDGDLFDPEYNLRVGTTYLAHLSKRFDGDPHLILAAYHMGPTKVAEHLREDDSLTGPKLVERHAGPKTKAYVKTVLRHADL